VLHIWTLSVTHHHQRRKCSRRAGKKQHKKTKKKVMTICFGGRKEGICSGEVERWKWKLLDWFGCWSMRSKATSSACEMNCEWFWDISRSSWPISRFPKNIRGSSNFELFIISLVELLEVPRSQLLKQQLLSSMRDEGKSLKLLWFQLQPSTLRL
jgi:hypothetical protein